MKYFAGLIKHALFFSFVRQPLMAIIIGSFAAAVIVAATVGDALAGDDAITLYTGSGSAARALFPANDLLDWVQLGPQCPTIGGLCIPNGVVATSNRGVAITNS
jgi:hypothetical protein